MAISCLYYFHQPAISHLLRVYWFTAILSYFTGSTSTLYGTTCRVIGNHRIWYPLVLSMTSVYSILFLSIFLVINQPHCPTNHYSTLLTFWWWYWLPVLSPLDGHWLVLTSQLSARGWDTHLLPDSRIVNVKSASIQSWVCVHSKMFHLLHKRYWLLLFIPVLPLKLWLSPASTVSYCLNHTGAD